MKTPFIRRVTIRNYKSIAASQVSLQPLMFLVGPNGAGKSNFLDALRFVTDSLRTSLDHALREVGWSVTFAVGVWRGESALKLILCV